MSEPLEPKVAARDRYVAAARAVDIKDSADRAQLDNDLETL